MREELQKALLRIVELEAEIASWKRRVYDLELEIVGKDHEIMTLQEAPRCDPYELDS